MKVYYKDKSKKQIVIDGEWEIEANLLKPTTIHINGKIDQEINFTKFFIKPHPKLHDKVKKEIKKNYDK